MGAELRALRDAKGSTLDEAARAAGSGWDKTRLSRVERAQLGIKPAVVELLLDAYDVTDADKREVLISLARAGARRGWWQTYSDIISPAYAELIALEADAKSLSTYQTLLIPGLLQTAAYARAAMSGINRASTAEEVDALVQVRIARQAVLSRPVPLKLWAIIHEAALRVDIDSRTMRAQLQNLLDQAERPNVSIQIMPIAKAPHPGMSGPFTVLGFPESADLDVVLVEHLASALYVESAADVSEYGAAFEHLRAEALPQDKSVDLTADILEKLR
ncbi:helix-turn-helix domain-containing protein [Streptomyces sp. NPDC051555]|uniref:helix-turn-helix domain-containing protein n=1 Tax=Streptomyces sp. NPDC051555 TaxID=3365657 RepID=UPI003788DC8A